MLCLAAGPDQRHASSAQRTFRRFVGLCGGTEATEEGHAEIFLLLGSIQQHADSHDSTFEFVYSRYDFQDGAACGQDIINYEDTFTRDDSEASTEGSFIAFFISKYSSDVELPGYFIGEDDATRSRASNYLHAIFLEVFCYKAAKLNGVLRILEDAEFFPVYWRMKSGGEQEVAFQHSAGVFEDLHYFAGHNLCAAISCWTRLAACLPAFRA